MRRAARVSLIALAFAIVLPSVRAGADRPGFDPASIDNAARVGELAGKLAGDPRRRAALVCAGAGIDLPR